MDTLNYSSFIFQLRSFSCDKTEYYFFAVGYSLERFKAAGALVVILKIVSIDVLTLKQEACNRIISSAAEKRGAEKLSAPRKGRHPQDPAGAVGHAEGHLRP